MNGFIGALGAALIAAIGNALFAFGNKKGFTGQNPFTFTIFNLLIGAGCLVVLSFFFKKPELGLFFKENTKWLAISSVGTAITYIGFYLLFTNYGPSYYVVYAVLSIVTTSIILGFFFFNLKFNLYYLGAFLTAGTTILLFYLGQNKP